MIRPPYGVPISPRNSAATAEMNNTALIVVSRTPAMTTGWLANGERLGTAVGYLRLCM